MLGARALVLFALAAPGGAGAFANVEVGGEVPQVELATLDGGRAPLLSPSARANVFVFFRPDQEHSTETLRAMADCEREMAGKPVHWVAVVSSTWEPGTVRKVVAEAGIRMPVLVDRGDALYGRLGVRLHPVVGVADGSFRLLAYEPFMKVNYCDRVRARIQLALGEIDEAAMRKVETPGRALKPGEIEGAAARRRLKLAEMLLAAKQWDKAAAEAAAVLDMDARSVGALILLGGARAGQGNCAEAAKAFDAALAVEPGNEAARRGKAACPPAS